MRAVIKADQGVDIQSKMQELARLVLRHRRLYYVFDTPEVADAEYDRLERELCDLEAQYPLLADPNSPTRRVGAAPLESFPKARHAIYMLSLDNAYSASDLREWEDRVMKGLNGTRPTYAAELKIDGLSLAIRYENRQLVQAITRGDGEWGEDVTENARTIADIPLELPLEAPENCEVRGEVFLSRKRWEELNAIRDQKGEPRFANPRNAASGTLKQLDSRVVAERRLQFLPWQLLNGADHRQAMENLAKWGFSTMPSRVEGDLETLLDFIETQAEARLKLPFDTDGIVIKVTDRLQQEKLGATERVPRWAIAFKYPATQATTEVKGITWQVGRSGKLTPVAELEAVDVAGSTVRRATLHNVEELERLGLTIGCRVFIEKGGDVIPKVVSVVEGSIPENATKPQAPKACPICNGEVGKESEDEVAIRCLNPECPAKLEARIQHLGSRVSLGIEGMGEALAVQLVASQRFTQPWEIFSLLQDKGQGLAFIAGLERMAEKSAQNFIQELEKACQKPLYKWVHALGISFVGEKTAELLSIAFPSLEALWAAQEVQLQSVEEVGPKVSGAIVAFRTLHPDLPQTLKAYGIQPLAPEIKAKGDLPLSGQIAVVTGTLPTLSREAAEGLLKDLGAKVTGSVSAKTSLLVAGEKAGSKLDKAQALDIPIRDEAWLLEQSKVIQ